jgi:hypothetical protein
MAKSYLRKKVKRKLSRKLTRKSTKKSQKTRRKSHKGGYLAPGWYVYWNREIRGAKYQHLPKHMLDSLIELSQLILPQVTDSKIRIVLMATGSILTLGATYFFSKVHDNLKIRRVRQLVETIIKETGYDINKLIKYKVTRPIASDLTFALYEFAKRETSLTDERKEYIDLEKLSKAVERGKYKKEIDKIKEEMTKILDQYPRKERPHTYYLLSKKEIF